MKKLVPLLLVILLSACQKTQPGIGGGTINPSNFYDNRSVGLSANDFLSAKKYKAINIEVQWMQYYEFPDEAIEEAVKFLEQYCYKPGGIRFTKKMLSPHGGGAIKVDNINEIENRLRTEFTHDDVKPDSDVDTLSLYILMTDSYYEDVNVLGLAYKNTALCLFGRTIHENSGDLNQPDLTTLTATVLKHELGHILGLVNLGSDMVTPHQDVANGKHCDNPQCLMYYTTQTKQVLGALIKGPAPVLDDNCKNDLHTNGGK